MADKPSRAKKDEQSPAGDTALALRKWLATGPKLPALLQPLELLEDRILLSAASPLKPAPHAAVTHAVNANVVLIDSTLANSALLVQAAKPGDQVFTFNGASTSPDSLLQEVYTWARQQRRLIASLSILGHGKSGDFELGDQWISNRALSRDGSHWQMLDQVLAPRAVIDLYGCDVAAPGGSGQGLLNHLARLTGATVFANTRLTGHTGDWILDAESSTHSTRATPETSSIFSLPALAAYPDDLATITITTAAAASPTTVTGTTTSLSVAASDTGGNSNLIYTWSASPTTHATTFSTNGTNSSNNTTATFSYYGTYTLTCTVSDSLGSTSVTSSVSVTVSQTFTSITFTGTTSSINEAQTKLITAKGYDQFGTVMATEPSWTWSITSGVGSLSVVNSLEDKYTPTNQAGTMVVQAAHGGISKTFNVTVVEVPPTVSTAAKATPSPATGTTTALSCLGASDGGASHLTYTWAATTEPSGATPTFSANGTNAAQSSTVTFNKAGAYTFQCTISDGQGGTITSSVNETVNQTLTSIVVNPTNATVKTSTTQQFTATGYDQFGVVMTSQPTFTWSMVAGGAGGTVSASGLYTAPSSVGSGSDTVKATSGAVSGTAAVTVTISSQAATATPSTVTGTNTSLSTLSSLDTGQATLTYTWATTGTPPAAVAFSVNGTNAAKNCTATFAAAGTYNLQVSVYLSGVLQSSSSCTVMVNQTLTSISVTPTTASLTYNQTQTLAASALDQFGNAMSSQPTFTWAMNGGSVGSFNSTSLVYTAGTSVGNATIVASSGGKSGNSVITVTEAPPTVATAAAASPSTVTGTTTTLSVLGASVGGESNLTYTWAATAQPTGSNPSFNDNASNAAKNVTVTFDTAGSYTFQVTIEDLSGNTVTSSVTVVVSQTTTAISVAPATASLNQGGTQAFSATATDQFGNTMSPEPTFTWSASSGTIDQSGNYTAPLVSATPTITATAGSASGTASVTVTNQPPTVATAASASFATSVGYISTDTTTQGTWQGTYGSDGYNIEGDASSLPSGVTTTFTGNSTYTWASSTSDVRGLQNPGGGRLATCWYATNSFTVNVNITNGQSYLLSLYVLDWDNYTGGRNEQIQVLNSTGTTVLATQTASSFQNGQYVQFLVSGNVQIQFTNLKSGANAVLSGMFFDAPPDLGTTANLNVLGADAGGVSNLSYTWSTTGTPPAAVTFSANGTNAAQNTTATFTKAGTYNFLATITNSGGLSTTSSVSVTVDQSFTSIAVTPGTAALNENQTQQFTATADDQFGNTMAAQPTFTWSKTAGIGSVNGSGLYTSPGAAGTATVQAASGGINGTAALTITDAPPTVATPAAATPSPVTGTTTALSVLGASDVGAANLTYTWAATTEPTGANPTFSANGTNAAQNTTVTFNTAGSYTFTVTINDGQGGTVTSAVNVTVNQTLTTISVTPASSALNENQTQQFSATGYDQFGNTMASQPTFTWSKTAGIGSVNGSGLYTSPGAAGTATVEATSGSVNGTAAVTITDSPPTVVTPAAAAPSTVTGTTTALSVLGASDVGAANLTYTWTATSEPPGANPTFSANGTNAAQNSTVTFNEAGSYTLTVTVNDGQGGTITSAVNVTVNQTLTSISVTPATAALNENQTQQVSATGYDQFGNAMTSQPTFTWSKPAGIGSINSTGLYTSPGAAGTATVQATSGSISGTASVTITDSPPTVATPAAASPSTVTGTTTALSVLGASDVGASNLTYTWAATSEPTGASPTFSVNGTNAAQNATVTFNMAGTYTFTVTIGDGQGQSVTSSVNVTVNQTLTTITVTPATAALNENQTQQFSATGYDQFGNAMALQPAFTWSQAAGIGSVNSSGLYSSPGAAGAATVQAASGGISGTAAVTITDSPPTVATPAAAAPSTVTGTTTALSVLGASDVGAANLTYTWAATSEPTGANATFSANGTNAAQNSTVTFTKAGNYTFTVTINDGQGGTVTSAVNVTVDQTLTTITVTPTNSALNENQTQQFSATGYDQFGTAMTSQPTFTWTKTAGSGSVNSSGLYTSPGASGTATIEAASAGINGTAALTITDSPPTVATPAAASPSTVTGTTAALSVLGASDVGAGNLTYTWAATSEPTGASPTFSVNGTNAARNSTVTFTQAGNYTFTVTISDGQGQSVTSAVNVTVDQTLTTIAVSPSSSSLNENQTQQFSATALDQFGNAMASQPTFTWSLASGAGSINPSGLYRAPWALGSATIEATSAAVSGMASITVAAPPLTAPTNLTAAASSSSSIALNWQNTDAFGTAVDVLRSVDGGSFSTLATLNATNSASTVGFDFIDGSGDAGTVTLDCVPSGLGAGSLWATGGSVTITASSDTTDVPLGTYPLIPNSAASLSYSSSPSGAFQIDNLIYPGNNAAVGNSFLTVNGLLFGKGNGGVELNIWGNGNGDYAFYAGYNGSSYPIAVGSGATLPHLATFSAASGFTDSTVISGHTYAYEVVAIDGAASSSPSAPAQVTIAKTSPTVATPAAANPNPVTGTTTALSVLGADDNGESNLTYTWATTGTPPAAVTFSDNGDNTAKDATATFTAAGVYTFQVTITNAWGLSTTSSVNVTVDQTLTAITVLPGTNSLNENQTEQLTATGYDQFGRAMTSQPSFAWNTTGGSVDTSGLYTAPGALAAGTYTINATSGSVTGSATVTVTNAAPTVATPAAASPSPVTGTTTALSVLGADDGGESNLIYTWATVGSPPAPVSFSANGTNAAQNTIATFTQAGSYTFQVTISDDEGKSVTSSVNATVDQTLTAISVFPATAALHENQTLQFSATGYDQFGNAMTSQPTFTWSQTAGIGSVNSAGLYRSPGAAGTATVQAASGSINGTAVVTITDSPPTVATPAAAAPSTVNGMTTALSVLGASDVGESNLTYTWAATSEPTGANATFSGNGTNAAQNSTVTFNQAGNYTFTVTISDGQGGTVTSAVNVDVNQTLTTISVTPGTAALNENQTQQFSATGYDQFGNAMTSQPTFTWSRTAGIGSVNSSGLYTSPGAAGTATVQAASGGIIGTAAVTITDSPPTVATPAAATPSTVTGTTTVLSVLGASDVGAGNLTYTWAATSEPTGANPTFSVNGTNASQDSTVTFNEAGSYTFTVTINDGQSQSVTSAVNVTVSQTLTTISVTPATATLNENQTEQLSASAYDQFGNAMTAQPTFTWTATAGSVNSSGLYTSPGALGSGTYTITATSGAVTGTATVDVSDAAPTVATPAAASPSPVTGTTTALSVLGTDDGGETNLTYSWAAVGNPPAAVNFSSNGTNASQDTTATFTKAGTYTFQVTITDEEGESVTSSVNVTVEQTLTTIAVTPPSSSLNENQTEQLTATGYDQFGTAMATQPTFTWSVTGGSIDSSGLYTSPGALGTGAYTITTTNGSITATATVNVTDAAPTVLLPAAASPNPVTGTTTELAVLADDDGGESNLTYTWATVGTPPAPVTFSANGTNAAWNPTATFTAAGTYIFQVTITDKEGESVTSSVNVLVDQTLTSITILPGSTSLSEDQPQQFLATGYDQFGDAMVAQPTLTWNATGGSIDSTGLYTAPGALAAGTYTISATSGSVTGTATATVTNAAPTVAIAAASPSPITGTTTALSVLGADDGGQSNLTYTWATLGNPPAPVTFIANGTNVSKDTVATFNAAGTYTFQVTITDEEGASVTSGVSVVVDQTLTTIAVLPGSASLNEIQTHPFSATGYDQFGIAMATQPILSWSATGGMVDSSGLYTAPAALGAGAYTISAASGSVTGSATITVTNAAPTVATPAAATPSPVTGPSTALSVLGADDAGEGHLTYTWAVLGKPPAAVTFSANGTNASKNTTATFSAAGAYTFQVTISDEEGASVTSSVNVTVDQTLTSITVVPGNSSLNENQAEQLTATGYDQFGNAMATQPTFSWSATGGSIDSTGLYNSPGALSAGTYTITATSAPISASATVTVADAAPTVATPAAASPSPIAGTTTSLSVLGADDGGETNLTYTWAAVGNPPATVNFSTNGTNASQDTTATFSKAGSYTFQVTITDEEGKSITSSVTVVVNQTLTSITVLPSTSSLNENQSESLAATGYDQFHHAMTIHPVWSKTSGIGTINSAGLYTSPSGTGAATITASSGSVSGLATITITNAAPTVAVAASASPSPVTGSTTQLTVLGADDGGEANLTYTWATTGSVPAPVLFSHNGDNTAQDITATFSAAGVYRFTVTITDQGGASVTSSVVVTVDQTLTSIDVTPATAALNENGTDAFSAVGYDQFNHAMTIQPTIDWSVSSHGGSIDEAGNYQAPAAPGTYTVTAASGTVTGEATVTVTNAAPTVVDPAAASAVINGDQVDLSTLGADDGGEANLTYTWAATSLPSGAHSPGFTQNGTNASKETTATFSATGTYTFTVTISDGSLSNTSAVSVVVSQILSSITVSPQATATPISISQQISAIAYDQFGTAMAQQPTFAWAVTIGNGSIDASGNFMAPSTAETDSVSASADGVTGSANIAIYNGSTAVATPSNVTGTTTILSVVGTPSNGLTYTWSVTSEPPGITDPQFSVNNSATAQNTTAMFFAPGDYVFAVTISDGITSSTDTISVTVVPTPTSLVVTPASTTIDQNQTTQLGAAVLDQFGLPLATQPTITWALSSGSGGVNANGLFAAASSPGSATVSASADGLSASATITIANAAPTIAIAAAVSPDPTSDTAATLSVLGTDDAAEANLTYTWQTFGSNPAPVQFLNNANNAAKNTTAIFSRAGTYDFIVTITDAQGLSATSTVTYTVSQSLSAIQINPGSTTILTNGIAGFTATAYDQFGQPIVLQPTFTWTVASGLGQISASGSYLASDVAGPVVIRASANGFTGLASVTVNLPRITASPFSIVPVSAPAWIAAPDPDAQALKLLGNSPASTAPSAARTQIESATTSEIGTVDAASNADRAPATIDPGTYTTGIATVIPGGTTPGGGTPLALADASETAPNPNGIPNAHPSGNTAGDNNQQNSTAQTGAANQSTANGTPSATPAQSGPGNPTTPVQPAVSAAGPQHQTALQILSRILDGFVALTAASLAGYLIALKIAGSTGGGVTGSQSPSDEKK
jgi:PKD repeat protein